MSALHGAAERLADEWANLCAAQVGPAEHHLARYILTELADPTSDHGDTLDAICRQRWTAGDRS